MDEGIAERSLTLRTKTGNEDNLVSVPQGGPIYASNQVGPLTGVPYFEASVLQLLQELESEIAPVSLAGDEDISVDGLKVFTEEDLVNKALEVAFKGSEVAEVSSQHAEDQPNAGRDGKYEDSNDGHGSLVPSGSGSNISAAFESSNDYCSISDCNRKNKSRKRRLRGGQRNSGIEDCYISKVEEVAKIKQKQDEDKAAVRLHSFNGSCKKNECTFPSSGKTERITSLRALKSAIKVKSSNVHDYVPLEYPEIVLCVEVYHNIRTWVKTQEFLVLGRQILTELRDNIYCLTDQIMQKAEQHDPSGYFLIEDFFCNDLRDPAAINYSEPIFDWLNKHKDDALRKWEYIISGEMQQKQRKLFGDTSTVHLPHFRVAEMEKTRFCDLSFRLGAGYLYCHQGDCKHTIVIRDVRLIHPEDVQNRAAYPIPTFQIKLRYQKCSVCKIYRATKVTVDDKWAQENPCYFCDGCYFLLHYSKDGSLLYSGFKVYDWIGFQSLPNNSIEHEPN